MRLEALGIFNRYGQSNDRVPGIRDCRAEIKRVLDCYGEAGPQDKKTWQGGFHALVSIGVETGFWLNLGAAGWVWR